MSHKIRMFALWQYIDAALRSAEYERDEDGGIVARVPDAQGFFSQGDTFEEARENLRDAKASVRMNAKPELVPVAVDIWKARVDVVAADD